MNRVLWAVVSTLGCAALLGVIILGGGALRNLLRKLDAAPGRDDGSGFEHLAMPAYDSDWEKADFLFRTTGSAPGTATPWVFSAWFRPKAASAAELSDLVRGLQAFAPPITFGDGVRDYAICQIASGADIDAGISLAPWARAEYCVQITRTRRLTVDAEHDYRQDCGWSSWPDEVLRCEPPPPPLPEPAPSCQPFCDRNGCLCVPFGTNTLLQPKEEWR